MTDSQMIHLLNSIEKLQGYKVGSEPILSVYLEDIDEKSGKELSEDFKGLINKSLIDYQVKEMESEIETISAYLKEDFGKKHLSEITFFAGKNMWEVINHDLEISSQCYISQSPNVKPLLNTLEKEGRYLFVVADREKAKFFTFYENQPEDYKEIIDLGVPQKVKAEKEYHISRHAEEHLRRHLQKISEEVDIFLNGKPVQGVFIGGHKVLFKKIQDLLSPHLKRKVKGDFVTELNIPQNEIVSNAKKALEGYLKSLTS